MEIHFDDLTDRKPVSNAFPYLYTTYLNKRYNYKGSKCFLRVITLSVLTHFVENCIFVTSADFETAS
jgi:hypothetical protein